MTSAIDFIKQAEGLRLKAYKDGAGVWTTGYGHTGSNVFEGLKITQKQADEFLRSDMSWALDAAEDTVKVELTEGQHAAVVSLIFNIGAPAWSGSTALRRLNRSNFTGAAEAMTWWNKITVGGKKVVSQGLVNRRERERQLFMGTAGDAASISVASGSVSGGEAKPARKSKTMWMGLSGVLASMLAAWSQIKSNAPELVEWAIPYLPFIFALIFAAVMFNRWWESRKGVH